MFIVGHPTSDFDLLTRILPIFVEFMMQYHQSFYFNGIFKIYKFYFYRN